LFPKTKYGCIGIRAEPRLLPAMGGEIVSSGSRGALRRGNADEVANGQSCDFVAYEAATSDGGRFGVCLLILDNSASSERAGPWFIRDYGMAMYNPTIQRDISIVAGESWTIGLRVVAYDGALTLDRAAAWRSIAQGETS
jgi:hypothetical protein